VSDDALLRRRRATFDGVAETYDAARPRYPRAVVDDLVALCGLGPGDRVLEIGCGTGQLSVDLAARGLDVTAVELGPALAAVARRNLAPFPQARVVVGAFEEFAAPEAVDAVVAASSFHWVPPRVRVGRSAAALRPGGSLAVVEVRHVAGGTDGFFAASQECYLRFDPETEPGFRMPAADEIPPAYPELDDPARFGSVHRRRHTWELDYSSDRFRALLSTYSNHIDLPARRREGLLDCIATLIDTRFGGTITKRYLAELVVGTRAS
jgi:SAM-dependent methyltransferase